MKKYRIYASVTEESKEGWVWISPSDNLTSEFVKIENPKSGKSIICERRIIDENYIKNYNSREGTINIKNDGNVLILNNSFRTQLGGIPTQSEVTLEIKEANGIIEKYISAPLHHPHPFVRISIELGLISVFLGLIGLALGIIGIFT